MANGSYDANYGHEGTRAGGGPVDAGKTYLVGEKGPELLRMGSGGGTVIPNGASSGASINYAPVIHIDARSDQAQVAAQTAQAVSAGNKQMLQLLKARGVL
jgi:phage-related minor tail protein